MDKIYPLKEDQKNNQVESYYKRKSNSFYKVNFSNKYDYSKRFKKKHLINMNKLFSKEKNEIHQASKFPLFNLNISKNSSIRLRDSVHSHIYTIQKEDYIEKERLISQIIKIEEEIYQKNEELEEYREFYKKLQENNLTFKAIIERILNIEDDSTITNNNSNNENKKEEEKAKKNSEKLKPKKINRLKLQIASYDKNIEEKDKFLDNTKNKRKINSFININKLLNEKNRELETLVSDGQKLQEFQHEAEKKINFYFDSITYFREEYTKLQDRLKINEKELNYNKNIIKEKDNEVEDCYFKIDKLEEELKLYEDINNKKKEEIEKINEKYENLKKMEKEKETIDKDLESTCNRISCIKKIIEKNNRNIIRIKNENDEFQNDISILKAENEIINEKTKQNQKNKNILKNYQKEIKQVKEEINKNKLKKENILAKDKMDKEKLKKEIEEFEKAKIGLINKINELTNELKEKTKENNIKEEELTKANEEYNNAMKDKL